MKLITNYFDHRGDTLVEVTIALAIMSAVLVSAFLLGEKSIQLGRTAKERTLMVSSAQQQAELLTAYRDRNNWITFVNNIRNYCNSPVGCTIIPTTMALVSGQQSVEGVPTSKIYITSDINGMVAPNPATFQINYEAEPSGGGNLMTSQVILQLGDTDSLHSQVVGP